MWSCKSVASRFKPITVPLVYITSVINTLSLMSTKQSVIVLWTKPCRKLSKGSMTINKAYALAEEYQGLCRLSDVHRNVPHGLTVTEAEAAIAKEKIDAYMGYYSHHFPLETITPKMDVLEDHACHSLDAEMGVWNALHGEQGGEATHKEFNKLARVMCEIKDPLQQPLATMRARSRTPGFNRPSCSQGDSTD